MIRRAKHATLLAFLAAFALMIEAREALETELPEGRSRNGTKAVLQ